MKVRHFFTKVFCPNCISDHPVDRMEVIKTMEQASDTLDRLGQTMRAIREEMAQGRNPILGERPEGR